MRVTIRVKRHVFAKGEEVPHVPDVLHLKESETPRYFTGQGR